MAKLVAANFAKSAKALANARNMTVKREMKIKGGKRSMKRSMKQKTRKLNRH